MGDEYHRGSCAAPQELHGYTSPRALRRWGSRDPVTAHAKRVRLDSQHRTRSRRGQEQIPPDLVVKSQAIDIAEVILSRIRQPHVVHTLCRPRKSRCELLSTSEAHWFTTKSDGMWFLTGLCSYGAVAS